MLHAISTLIRYDHSQVMLFDCDRDMLPTFKHRLGGLSLQEKFDHDSLALTQRIFYSLVATPMSVHQLAYQLVKRSRRNGARPGRWQSLSGS